MVSSNYSFFIIKTISLSEKLICGKILNMRVTVIPIVISELGDLRRLVVTQTPVENQQINSQEIIIIIIIIIQTYQSR